MAVAEAVTRREARKILLSRQGLAKADQFGRGIDAVRSALDSIGWVQIDTISVVQRAHHHILNTRVSDYRPAHLHALQYERRDVFEYWSHAAACLPIGDYRYCLPLMIGSKAKRPPDKKLATLILRRIAAEGPLQSKDFAAPPTHRSGGWWDFGPAKRALERLYLSGDLMVSHRDGFRKVYDLPERVLPSDTDTSLPTDAEWNDYMVRRAVSSWGIVTDYDIGYCRTAVRQLSGRSVGQSLKASVERLCASGELVQLSVEGARHYCSNASLSALSVRSGKRRVRVLSPFDNLVINRRKAFELFDFDYQIECYVPKAKRRYGYFCLPVLYGDELIGRLDASADTNARTLVIKSFYLEPQTRVTDALAAAVSAGLHRLGSDNDCDSIRIESCEPAAFARMLAL